MKESMLICAPHANSYHRFQNDSCAPVNMSWGYNNRTVSIRIPPSEGSDTRIEHRLAGADANPYLLVSSLLCGILHGFNQKKDPLRLRMEILTCRTVLNCPELGKRQEIILNSQKFYQNILVMIFVNCLQI